MPDYSQAAKERDIYGELGWIPNMHVKVSKNNDKYHSTTREYFDQPMNYHATFNNSTMTNSEFFRQNAPQNSIAKERVKTLSVVHKSRMGSTLRSTQSTFSTSLYATPFILDRDTNNKYKVSKKIDKTSPITNQIPFLRTPQVEYKNELTSSPRRRKVKPFSNVIDITDRKDRHMRHH